ncbi:MAG TPA: F0F1 ATP synthase subunit alpha [Anaerolineaceae bacterium]|jgi:F-type H+-transporting ATPase subunit alpha|nr:F0F1 ATP synthase subunit alpha [Anaerolineaceae bacterium]
MTDIDTRTNEILARFTEKLATDDPLNVSSDVFVAKSVNRVEEKVGPQPSSLRTRYLLKEIRDSADILKHRMLFKSVGTVQHVGNGVATLSGLPLVHLEELVVFPNGTQGMVLNLDRNHVDVMLLGDDMGIRGGDLTQATGRRLSVPVGMGFLGRVVNALGEAIDEQRAVIPSEYRFVERIAPGVIERAPVDTPLYTGTKIIDALLPLGRGQRELIIGDRQVGKTTLALDAILTQRGTDVKCIYVSIGQKKTSVLSAVKTLRDGGVMNQTTVIVSSPDDPPALRYLAPYTGVTLAEFYLDQGMDVLIVYDDLSKHADTYRELSLLLRRPPGREAYPGDIFYLHSRLLERACRLNEENGGGSITALPIVTTQRGNISSYIVTNLISITDGQIVLNTNDFNKGDKPAIDIGMSVSRVGSAAQESAMKDVVKALKLELAQYEEVARFSRFGTEVSESTQKQIERGDRLMALLRQGPHQPVKFTEQVLLFYCFSSGQFDTVTPAEIPQFSEALLQHLHVHAPQAVDIIRYQRILSDEAKAQIDEAVQGFDQLWLKKRSKTR